MQNENISTDKPKQPKSRHLSTLEFYENLQVEFIVADLRHKIYPKLKDKAYWGRVKEGKKQTIEKLAERNALPSIFTDPAMLREFEKKIYRDQSHPLFTYRDEMHEMEQSYLDLKYYYNIGAEVRVDMDGDVSVGKVSKEYIPYKDVSVFVSIKGVENKYNIKQVTRIL